MVVKLYIGETRLDLFQDENIEVTSSITNSSDITKNTTDYSKDFTVPATNINNQVFKHYYNANIDNTFDARIKVDGRIELDGIPYKSGKWRLEKVNVKSGYPSSYTIVFFGSLVSLVDLLGDDLLSDLDLSDYDHLYNSDNVEDGLTTGLFFDGFTPQIVYNLLAKKRYIYDSDVTNTTQTDALSNIAVTGTSNGVTWNDLRPSIRLKAIIDAIETDYGITFSNDFFGRFEFTQLYMWLNNEASSKSIQQSQKINFSSIVPTVNNFDLSTDTWTGTTFNNNIADRNIYFYRVEVTPDTGFETIPYAIVVKNGNDEVLRVNRTGTGNTGTVQFITVEPTDFSYTFYIETAQAFDYDVTLFINQITNFASINGEVIATGQSILPTFEINKNIPKLKVIDFLTGLFKMFKLVVFQDGNEIYINTLKDYYQEGTLRDVTRYIDFESNDVARGKILKEIKFNFEEPTTILNEQFKNNTTIAYGDEELNLTDANGKPLDGENLEYKIPFEQIIFERLQDLDDNELTNIQYGAVIDESLNAVNPKPVIYYNEIISLGLKQFSFIDDTGTQVVLGTNINTPSQLYPLNNQIYSTLFGAEFSTWDGTLVNNTLYSNYHKDYIESIFNIKRREFTFTAVLPLQVLSSLKLNDVLKIQDNYYRIDNFTLNLTNGVSKLNLINSFDNTLVRLATDTTSIFVDFREQSRTVYTRFVNPIIVDFDGLGYGTTWLSGSSDRSIVTVTFDENLSLADRDANLFITDSVTLERITIYLNQTA
jgi:hypothetical protein